MFVRRWFYHLTLSSSDALYSMLCTLGHGGVPIADRIQLDLVTEYVILGGWECDRRDHDGLPEKILNAHRQERGLVVRDFWRPPEADELNGDAHRGNDDRLHRFCCAGCLCPLRIVVSSAFNLRWGRQRSPLHGRADLCHHNVSLSMLHVEVPKF